MTGLADRIRLDTKFVDLVVDQTAADGSFTGYASLFGRTDLGRDVIEPGAFKRSLARRGAAGIRMLFQHDPGSPIGTWLKVQEDAAGLRVAGRLAAGVTKAEEIGRLLRSGGLDGLSIGFRTIRAKKDRRTGIRHILEADLWEISVVTFPMQEGARIDAVKGRGRCLPTIREFERWLMRDAELTRREAKHVIARGFASLKRGRDAADDTTAGLAARIRRAAETIQSKDSHR